MLLKGTALVECDDREVELSEGGIVFLPTNSPRANRITSKKGDLLTMNIPAGIEGVFRYPGAAGRPRVRTASRLGWHDWPRGRRSSGTSSSGHHAEPARRTIERTIVTTTGDRDVNR